MEIKDIWKTGLGFWQKYKYAVLILLAGLALMLLPDLSSNTDDGPSPTEPASQSHTTEEQKLESILSDIQGAGEVRVMLSLARGEETVYQTDTDNSSGENNSSIRLESGIINAQDRSESGLIRQVNPPIYQGAVVVCEGGDDPRVRLAIVEAVSDITGLGSDKISVLKMK